MLTDKRFIYIISIVIPIAVALLFLVKIEGFDFTFLPPIYASINGITALVLLLALLYIKNKNIKMHERMMSFAMFLSVLFLLMYVVYHATSDSTSFGGVGVVKYFYLIVLLTHILLSIAVLPLVLFALHYAKLNEIEKHKRLVKFSYPIWLYVAISGVVVFIMISPYYH